MSEGMQINWYFCLNNALKTHCAAWMMMCSNLCSFCFLLYSPKHLKGTFLREKLKESSEKGVIVRSSLPILLWVKTLTIVRKMFPFQPTKTRGLSLFQHSRYSVNKEKYFDCLKDVPMQKLKIICHLQFHGIFWWSFTLFTGISLTNTRRTSNVYWLEYLWCKGIYFHFSWIECHL